MSSVVRYFVETTFIGEFDSHMLPPLIGFVVSDFAVAHHILFLSVYVLGFNADLCRRSQSLCQPAGGNASAPPLSLPAS